MGRCWCGGGGGVCGGRGGGVCDGDDGVDGWLFAWDLVVEEKYDLNRVKVNVGSGRWRCESSSGRGGISMLAF